MEWVAKVEVVAQVALLQTSVRSAALRKAKEEAARALAECVQAVWRQFSLERKLENL